MTLLAGIGEKLLLCPICNGRAKQTMGKCGGYIECIECGLRTHARNERKSLQSSPVADTKK